MIHALIWDAGGTLFDTYPAVVEACQSILRSRGIAIEDARLMDLFRQTTSYAIRKLAETFGLDSEDLERDFRDAYATIPPERQPLFPGVLSVCHYIRRIGGYNFIVTHRDWQSLQPLLDHNGMRDLFAHWITEEDPYPRKPDPASIRAVIDRYDLIATACMAIGDRKLDIVAARRAGVRSCFFTGGDSRSDATVRSSAYPDLVVSDFHQLLTWLQSENT